MVSPISFDSFTSWFNSGDTLRSDLVLAQLSTTPAAQPAAKVTSTTSTIGAWVETPKNQWSTTVCWLFSAKAKRVKIQATMH